MGGGNKSININLTNTNEKQTHDKQTVIEIYYALQSCNDISTNNIQYIKL